MWRLIPDLSIPKSSAIAFCVHQMVSSFITTCTLPSLSGRLYNKNCISLLIVSCICVELQSIQLFHNLLFQPMAFFKLLEECLFIICHTVVKLFFRYIYIIYLDVEILSGRKRIALFLYLIVRNSYGKSSTASLRWNVPTIFSISSSFRRTFSIR